MWRRLLMVLAAAGAGAAGMTMWRLARDAEGSATKGGGGRAPGGSRPERPPAPAGSAEARIAGTGQPAGAAAARPGTRRCAAITQGGTRCTRDVEAGSDYCWQHGS